MKTLFLYIMCFSLLAATSCQKYESAKQSQGQIELTSNELQPDNYFQDALTAFADKKYTQASDAINLGIGAMEQIIAKADESQRLSIQNSIKELKELSDKVAIDQVDGINQLNYFFAKAGEALAGLHMHISKTEYINLSGKEAGANLERAIAEIEQTIKYHGRDLTKDEATLMSYLRQEALRLRTGEKISQSDMEANFEKLNNHIQQLDAELEVKYTNFKTEKTIIIHDKPN